MRMPLINVKIHWRTIQICINICSVVTGFCAFLPLGYVSKMFVNYCVLYADIKIANIDETSLTVDTEKSNWGNPSTCQFAVFTTVIASIHAFIWIWFFLTMKKELKKEGEMFPMLLASFLLHGMSMVAVIISSGVISAGVATWCTNLAREVTKKTSGQITTCSATQDLTWNVIGEQKSFQKFLMVSKVSSWLCVVTIMCQFLVCGYKLYVWALQITLLSGSKPAIESKSSSDTNITTNGYKQLSNGDADFSEDTPTCSTYVNGNGHAPTRHWIVSTSSDTSMSKMV